MSKTLKRNFEKLKTTVRKNPIKSAAAALLAYNLIKNRRSIKFHLKDSSDPFLNRAEAILYEATDFPGRRAILKGTGLHTKIQDRWHDRRMKSFEDEINAEDE